MNTLATSTSQSSLPALAGAGSVTDSRTSRAESFSLHMTRFTLIDTAEESAVWASRARHQWGDGTTLSIRVSTQSTVRGATPPTKITYGRHQAWTGIEYDEAATIPIPLLDDPILVVEVFHPRKNHPDDVYGIGVVNAEAMVAEARQYAKYCVHILPVHAAIDDNTVHAVAELEIHSSLLDEPPENTFTPLEYNYGSVRVSSVDFYYPPFLITGTGQYIVSNVICAMNMTESSSLAMQLVPLKDAGRYIYTEPSKVITVRPQQRVYFSATWMLSQQACMRPLELQLTVNGSQQASAPIIIKAHCGLPQPTTTDMPYHYWVNTTCLMNRNMMATLEMPLIRAILPVFRFITSGPIDQTEGMIVAFDKDKGEQVLVRANGLPVQMGTVGGSYNTSNTPSLLDAIDSATSAAALTTATTDFLNSLVNQSSNSSGGGGADFGNMMLDTNASFVVRDRSANRNPLPSRGPLLNLSQKTCLCTIALGPIRGFPMVYETTTGVSPSFQVSLTLLDQKGWQIIRGETMPSYQSASGSLRWSEQLVLRKWPGAVGAQFVRLNLTEVRPRDGDETPIGAGLISLGDLHRTHVHTPMSVAFYVYETYSLYDELNSPSLLMKDVHVVFSEMR